MSTFTNVLREAGLVVLLGVGLGLGLNATADDGLELGRDHFPKLGSRPPATVGEPSTPTAPGQATDPAADATTVDAPDSDPAGDEPVDDHDPAASPHGEATAPADDPFAPAHVLERLASHGLEALSFAEARALHEDPMYGFGLYAFIDARQPEPYAEGHIPGAWLFDRYRPEGYLADMQTLIATCEKLVVYCNGGECDDSEFAADFLRQFGARPGQLYVFVGGMEQWRHEGLAIETGERGSGAGVDGADQ